jgi:hypothetical protein
MPTKVGASRISITRSPGSRPRFASLGGGAVRLSWVGLAATARRIPLFSGGLATTAACRTHKDAQRDRWLVDHANVLRRPRPPANGRRGPNRPP